jgi:hypothetical protein
MSRGDREDRESKHWPSEPNREYNRDGGNSCSNPNWGTGNHGDANPDTQKEPTVIQQNEAKEDKK